MKKYPSVLTTNPAYRVHALTAVAGPEVENVSPNVASVDGGEDVVATGLRFTGATAVLFGATPAASFVVDNDTQITAVTPPLSAGLKSFTVTTPYGTDTLNGAITFASAYHFSGISPDHGSEDGGTLVTATGSGFLLATDVTVDGVSVDFTIVDDETITFIIPAGAVGDVSVSIIAPGVIPQSATFTYEASEEWAPPDAGEAIAAWYRADLGIELDDDIVVGLSDQSGTGDASKDLSAGGEPEYNGANADYGGNATIHFDGGMTLVRAGDWADALTGPVTIIVVGQSDSGANSSLLSDGAAGHMLWDDGSETHFYNAGAQPSGASPGLGNPAVFMLEDSGDPEEGVEEEDKEAYKLFVNDLSTPIAKGATCFGTAAGIDIGVGVVGISNLVGKIAEVIVYRGILSTEDKANFATYCNTTRAYEIAVSS